MGHLPSFGLGHSIVDSVWTQFDHSSLLSVVKISKFMIHQSCCYSVYIVPVNTVAFSIF
jgi:hypothetical protein